MATWTLDKAHSEIEFKVRHMMISSVKGSFQDFEVNISNEPAEITDAQVEVVIQTDSINTKNEQRDQHLKSADFFDASSFAEIKFKSTAITAKGDGDYEMTGELTVKDKTNTVTLDVESGGIAKDPWGNQKAGYTVTGKINREEFGLTWNATLETGGVMVSDDVKFSAEIQFILS